MCFVPYEHLCLDVCVCVCVCSSIHIITCLSIWTCTFSLMRKHLKLSLILLRKKTISHHVFLQRQNIFLYLYVPRPCLTGQCSCHICWLGCASVFLCLTETSNLLLFQEAAHLTIIVIFSHVMRWPWVFWMTPKGVLSLNDSNCIIIVLLRVLISYLFITVLLSQITYFTSGISFDLL